MDQDLDAGLVFVVAPSEQIVDTHDGFQIAQQFRFRQKVAHGHANHGESALATANDHFPTTLSCFIEMQAQADVVELHRCPVRRSSRHCDLELSREERELRMQRRPLTDELGDRARIC